MTNIHINPILDTESLPAQTCQKKHHAWATTIGQNELAINQLLKLLLNVLEQHNYQNLHHQAVYLHGDLKRLKNRFQRLRLDMICERDCTISVQQPPCKPRIELYSTMAVDSYLYTLTEDLYRIKAECNQLLLMLAS